MTDRDDERILNERDIPIDRILDEVVQTHGKARVFELCYWAAEPGFFDLVRALYAVPECSRAAIRDFLKATPRPGDLVTVAEPGGRLTLDRGDTAAGAAVPARAGIRIAS
jgi:hypothetical protein